jgi:hypothetical protein
MSDKGAIGVLGSPGVPAVELNSYATIRTIQPPQFRAIQDHAREYVIGSGQAAATGHATATYALQLGRQGSYRFRWVVKAGSRTASIDVRAPLNLSPYPRITILSNPEIGLPSDVVGDAIAGAGWQTIGPLTVVVTTAGVLEVVLENRQTQPWGPSQDSSVYFTNWNPT